MTTTRTGRNLAAGLLAVATASSLLTAAAPAWAADATSTITPGASARAGTPIAPRATQALDQAPRQGTPAAVALAHLKDHRDVFQVDPATLEVVGTSTTGDQVAVRLQQKHQGVPVFGAQYAVQMDKVPGGLFVRSATGTLYTALSVSTTPTVSEDRARARMSVLDRHVATAEDAKTEDHGLIVMPSAAGGRLAWHFTVRGMDPNGEALRQEVYVDAAIGGIMLSYNNIDAVDAQPAANPVTGTGVRFDGTEAPLAVDQAAADSFRLVDSSRSMFTRTGGQIITYDAQRRVYTSIAGGPVPEGVPVVGAATSRFDATATTSGAVDAHLNAGKVYTYLRDQLGRDGIDGKGGSIYSVVNVSSNGTSDYQNAFWDGSKMVYGHMNKGVPLSVGLDVVGHEMTHGVTEHTAGLVYLNQPGALNEAISDYFGNAMETADRGISMTDETAGYVGEYLCNGTKTLKACALRDLNDGRVAGPDYKQATLDVDNGGVHYNSTIVGGAMWDVRERLDQKLADQIVYRASQSYLTPLSGFSDMRTAMYLSAKSLKVSKDTLATIEKAFDDHGIVEGWEDRRGTHDGVTLSEDVMPAYELTSGVDEQAAQVSGDVYAISHGDAIAWNNGGAEFGITVGRFDKQAGDSDHELADGSAYLLDPSLDADRVVFTRVAADGVDIYGAGDKGQGEIQPLVTTDADETEPVTDNGTLAWISTKDGEQDVMFRGADGTVTNLTPEAGTTAAHLAMKNGHIAWSDTRGKTMYLHDLATGTTQVQKITFYISNTITDVQLNADGVYWRESSWFIFPSSSFYRASLDNLAGRKKLTTPSLYLAQFSVSDTAFAYSTYDIWGALGSYSATASKVKVAPVADVVAGTATWLRASCSSGYQIAPSLGDGERVVWLDTTSASTDVVTRDTFAKTCP